MEEKPIFARDEWNAFYSATIDYYKPFVAFLLVTGCRIGKATAVRIGDLNFKSNTVSVVRAWKKVAKGRVIGAPKSARSCRVVMVDSKTMAAIADPCAGRDPSDLPFVAPHGGQIHPHRFNERHWWPTMERAGINKHLNPHSLRHTFASWQLMAGTPPQVVQMRMGHSSLATTSNAYARLLLRT
ncbi:site-specific integrase [Glutamicibacter sp. Je.9.36]|uniref:site-specific integrase n=1 Tax=Glutamicibacter sp. Je.9.36 TaxID=3142837 RepID=UPI003DA9F327